METFRVVLFCQSARLLIRYLTTSYSSRPAGDSRAIWLLHSLCAFRWKRASTRSIWCNDIVALRNEKSIGKLTRLPFSISYLMTATLLAPSGNVYTDYLYPIPGNNNLSLYIIRNQTNKWRHYPIVVVWGSGYLNLPYHAIYWCPLQVYRDKSIFFLRSLKSKSSVQNKVYFHKVD